MNEAILQNAANQARGLAMDAVSACKSGHLGLPLGAAEMGAVLFGETEMGIQCNPKDPKWLNRDRFVLSAGHGSMFLYAWLHMAGYDLPLEQVKNFRQLHSMTPGHPEFAETPGVESTTGPLGQGIGNAVGMAIAAKKAAAQFNTAEHTVFDHHVIALAGDGCLQEGVAAEAASLAGHLRLDNLVLIYDSNDVTLDAAAEMTQSENVAERFDAYGFEVQRVDGQNMAEFLEALKRAKSSTSGKPQFIEAKTLIGKGIPEVAGQSKAHGEAGVAFVEEARKNLGLPEERFYVSQEVRGYFAEAQAKRQAKYDAWQAMFKAWQAANPALAKLLQEGVELKLPADLMAAIPPAEAGKADATRNSGGVVLQAIAKQMPLVLSGSADLHGSTKNYIKDGGDFTKDNRSGRNFHFGIREHAMGAITNGIGYYGIYRMSCATFLVFSDYLRPAIRLAALAKLPVFYIFTHDSVGVGEDGPTHQPVEHVSSLRLIPNLDVIRPGDAEETAGAFAAAIERTDGPTALILSRQNVADQQSLSVEKRRMGTLKGGYVAREEIGNLQGIIMASGSELQHAMQAAEQIGAGVRVVSMPCMERFKRQDKAYRESVLPAHCKCRVAIEAGTTALWHEFVGSEGTVLGIDRFGISAPGGTVMKELGMTAEALVAAFAKNEACVGA